MKIAVSGSAGIGKSTFARALAGSLSVVYLDEGYDRFFASPGRFNGSSPAELVVLFNQVLDFKLERESRYEACVCDRCRGGSPSWSVDCVPAEDFAEQGSDMRPCPGRRGLCREGDPGPGARPGEGR